MGGLVSPKAAIHTINESSAKIIIIFVKTKRQTYAYNLIISLLYVKLIWVVLIKALTRSHFSPVIQLLQTLLQQYQNF